MHYYSEVEDMDVRELWNSNRIARHVCLTASVILPDDIWLLAHERLIIVVRGAGIEAASLGSVTVPPISGDTTSYRSALERVLDELQDLVIDATGRPWPGSAGRLRAFAVAEGERIKIGYAMSSVTSDGEPRFTLSPFETGGSGSSSIRVGG
jgi:hypothetical protein